MSDNNTLDLDLIGNFDMTMDKNDLVAVLVAEYEAQQCLKRKGFESQRKALLAQKAQNTKEANEIVEAHATNSIAEKFSRLVETFAFVNPQAEITLKLTNQPAPQRICASVIKSDVRYGSIHVETYDWPQEACDLIDENEVLDQQIQELDTQLYEVRRKLANLSTMERQAKAQVARAALEKSDNGRKLLDLIKERELKQLDLV